ncbi:MAG: T9SS type A sorting domain-containing protein [Bacteroidota bacterium]
MKLTFKSAIVLLVSSLLANPVSAQLTGRNAHYFEPGSIQALNAEPAVSATGFRPERQSMNRVTDSPLNTDYLPGPAYKSSEVPGINLPDSITSQYGSAGRLFSERLNYNAAGKPVYTYYATAGVPFSAEDFQYDNAGRLTARTGYTYNEINQSYTKYYTDSTAFTNDGYVSLRAYSYLSSSGLWQSGSNQQFTYTFNNQGFIDSAYLLKWNGLDIPQRPYYTSYKALSHSPTGEILKIRNINGIPGRDEYNDTTVINYVSWNRWQAPLPDYGRCDSLSYQPKVAVVGLPYLMYRSEKYDYTPDGGYILTATYNEMNTPGPVAPHSRYIEHYDSHGYMDLNETDTIIANAPVRRYGTQYVNAYDNLGRLIKSEVYNLSNRSSGTSLSATYNFFYFDITGNAALKKAGTLFSASPNPFGNSLYIRLCSSSKAISYTLTDLSGRTLKTAALNAGEEKISINTEDLKPGIYLLSAFSADNVKQTVKVCKAE